MILEAQQKDFKQKWNKICKEVQEAAKRKGVDLNKVPITYEGEMHVDRKSTRSVYDKNRNK